MSVSTSSEQITQVYSSNNCKSHYPLASEKLPIQTKSYLFMMVWHTEVINGVNKTCYDFLCQCLPEVSCQTDQSHCAKSISHTGQHASDGVVATVKYLGHFFKYVLFFPTSVQWTAAHNSEQQVWLRHEWLLLM